MKSACIWAIAAALAPLFAGGSASAASSRTWVSGHGADQAGCGAPTVPCRSLQYAHDHVIAGGEIDILDPAGYGAITITKAISIVNDGVGTAGVQATSGSAITINAGAADAVYLRGLNIDGVSGAADNGVLFNSGASLTVIDCVARHFGSDGIAFKPTTGTTKVLVFNTVASDNGVTGIGFVYAPMATASVSAVIDHVIANNGRNGIQIVAGDTSGTVSFNITNVIADNNSDIGLDIEGNSTALFIVDRDNSSQNGTGLLIGGGSVYLSQSVIDGNVLGIFNDALTGGTFSSGDNHVDGNGTQTSGAALQSDGTI